jgi:hypothetical protein
VPADPRLRGDGDDGTRGDAGAKVAMIHALGDGKP